jgi:hypothetical protein
VCLASLLQAVFEVEEGRDREDHIARRGEVAQLVAAVSRLQDRPFVFLLNFQVPGDPPLCLVFAFALPRPQEHQVGAGPFWRLFSQYVAQEHEPPSGEFPLDDFKNKRFKLIPSIVDGPSVVKWAVGAKPAILGQKVGELPHARISVR